MVTLQPIQPESIAAQAIAPNQRLQGMVTPPTQAALAQAVADLAAEQLRLLPCGAGSKLDWGGLVQADVLVSTAGLNRLIEHAVGDLTVTVEAGMPLARLQAILAEQGQFLAIDPSYADQTTIGGLLSTGDGGALRQRYHSLRDMVLGVTLVRADGQIAKAGGRVVKNVAGYDLMKLLTGAYGTLGILTQVTLRVYPQPAQSQTVLVRGAAGALAQARTAILLSSLTPTAIDLLSSEANLAVTACSGPILVLRFQTSSAGISAQVELLKTLLQPLGLALELLTPETEATLWQRLETCMSDRPRRDCLVAKLGIKPNRAIAAFTQFEDLLGAAVTWRAQVHAGSGLGRLVIEPASQLAPQIIPQLRQILGLEGGFLSILQAPVSLKQQIDVWGYSGNAIATMQAIKAQFDPENRLSPGRFVGGI